MVLHNFITCCICAMPPAVGGISSNCLEARDPKKEKILIVLLL